MKLAKTAAVAAMAGLGCLGMFADEARIESRAYYSTNPENAVGQVASISIDGEFTDWNESMIIATAGANDICTAFHGSHENCVVDLYALYAAWDDANLYIAWQCCNTGDTWARPGDGPLTDGGRIGDVPFIVALSIAPSTPCMTGKLEDGRYIWGERASGVEFANHVDHLLFMSAKPGQGDPAMFTGNAKGEANYGSNCHKFSSLGISYKMKEGFQPSHLWRQKTFAVWSDATTLVSDPSIINNIYDAENYDNLLGSEPIEGLTKHDTKFDSFFELKIPFSALGISRKWLEENGIGCRVIGTRGESGIDCIPFDPSMVDNVFEEYAKDNSTSHEKDDTDIITYDLASIGKLRQPGQVVTPPGPIGPDPNDPDPVNPDPNDTPLQGDYVVYFQDKEWNAPNCYIWDAGNNNKQYCGAWPGKPMTAVTINGSRMFGYALSTSDVLVKPMVIFNQNGQTKDLELQHNGIYTRSGVQNAYSGVRNISVSADITVNGRTVSAHGPVEVYTLNGQRVATSNGTVTIASPGMYIVRANGNARKVVIK